MATGFRQWESDPLFSAAEVVQDSADRMDSIFRMLLHDQSLVQDTLSDPKLLSSIEYHKRDLMTTLGTAKWQLEDFERAVNLSALSDKSHLRGNAISQHKQFIRAIREQIIQVEKSLEEPLLGDSSTNSQSVNLNEHDRDGLALFLSGGKPVDHHAHYDSEDSSIMRRFFDSTTASGFDNKSDEIVELNPEENEDSKLNGVMHLDHNFDLLKEHKLRRVGLHHPAGLGFEASVALQDSSGNRNGEAGGWDLEKCNSNAKSLFSKNKLRGSYNILNVLRFLGNYWPAFGNNMTRSSTKKWKDGEMGLEFDQRSSSSYIDMSQVEQTSKVACPSQSPSCTIVISYTHYTDGSSYLGFSSCLRAAYLSVCCRDSMVTAYCVVNGTIQWMLKYLKRTIKKIPCSTSLIPRTGIIHGEVAAATGGNFLIHDQFGSLPKMQNEISAEQAEERFQVRRLEIADKSKGFIELLQQLSVCDSVSEEEFRARFQELKSHADDHVIFVIEDKRSSKIIATGSIFVEKKFLRNCGKVGHIEDVVVDSSARGMKLGQKIISSLTDHARSVGCYKVILDCSLDNKGFYEKCGFQQKSIQMASLQQAKLTRNLVGLILMVFDCWR
ncbi:hypothetical protein NE237_005239 [Protea cynaroides]|uniref:glucosamine-phosphate N-acetyltransferase n=1 Tax=Protea cynaroides TaxID=273540 RepID=A0A9Q0KKH3_9MAGN|nr:hypothetical protein NE237_005239 [Protea cynaroides]